MYQAVSSFSAHTIFPILGDPAPPTVLPLTLRFAFFAFPPPLTLPFPLTLTFPYPSCPVSTLFFLQVSSLPIENLLPSTRQPAMRSHYSDMADFRPLSCLFSLFTLRSKSGAMLRFYFRSGWAFLIPYLVVYLLYAWLKWPVNPITQGAGSMVQGARSWMPCLLHVYWSFHIAHLCLGALALRAWWLTSEATKTGALHHNSRQLGNTLQVTGNRLHATIYQLLPWICLGLIFWISSVYLEFPSDPWEHYRRINLWGQFNDVTSNSVWIKSSYFFAYSFTSNLTAAQQFDRLNYYTTGLNILLCFQYYRLGRAIGLSVNAAIIFVILQSLLFGNNLFSFYNYYSLSSTAIAQIAAIALICTGYRFVAADSSTPPFSFLLLSFLDFTIYNISFYCMIKYIFTTFLIR